MSTFYELGLSHTVIRAISNMGFEETTPIQEKTIKPAIEGSNIVGQAQTGTGKTTAFGIPLVEKIDGETRKPKGLVVAPTRELAVQVAEEINRIGQYKGIKALPIYGGQDINRQIRSLKKNPQIIVATPGRLMDHMRRKTIRLETISIVVIDEADEMLNMGFIEDIEEILKEVPKERQTMLFSATIPKPIRKLAETFIENPEFISIKPKEIVAPNTEQYYIEVQEKSKFDIFCRLLDIQSPELAIVFGRTKKRVDELSEGLNKRGYSAEGIHGDLSQAKRDTVLRHFKEGMTEILVATDVAARGLDITGVTHIYNFDIPQDTEGYVHRIGRTGRAGKSGLAITLVTPREKGHLKQIEEMTKANISRKPIPSMNEAIEGQQQIAVEKITKAVENGNHHQYKELAEGLLDSNDSVTLLSAALKLLTKEPDTTPVRLSDEAPLRIRKKREHDRKKPNYNRQKGNQNKKGRKPYNRKKQYQKTN